MTVHIVSETEFVTKGQGVHTAFVDHVEIMREKNDIDVVVNEEGTGDVFHSHTYGPYFFWKGRNYKGRRVFTVHVIPESIKGSLPLWKLWLPMIRWYFKQVYSYADVCIAISPLVEKAIMDLGSKTRIVKINNPINTQKWRYSKEKRRIGREMLGLTPDEFVVLGVGQIQPRKGVDDFIDVGANIPEAKFVWVGGRPFGALTDGIKHLNTRIEHATSNIKFVGLLDLEKMPYVYAASDVLLFTSYQENCPLAPLEAAACGIPVVYRDIIEYQKLYQYPYLKANDNDGFTQILKQLMMDKKFYLGATDISNQLIKQFDKEMVREKLISLYFELTNNSVNYKKSRELEKVKIPKEKILVSSYF
jgi:1,2-diacylglycerol-3-alpha-glucose alpha-1,2-galactosyltransferase